MNLTSNILEVLANEIILKEAIRGIRIIKEELNPSLFVDVDDKIKWKPKRIIRIML